MKSWYTISNKEIVGSILDLAKLSRHFHEACFYCIHFFVLNLTKIYTLRSLALERPNNKIAQGSAEIKLSALWTDGKGRWSNRTRSEFKQEHAD